MKEIADAVRRAIGDVAPTVGAALGGPLGGVVGRSVSQVLTGRPDAPAEAIAKEVADLTPEQAAALEALELQMTRRLEVAAEDRANARDTFANDPFPRILGGIAMAGLLTVIAVLFWRSPPHGSAELIYIVVGVLVSQVDRVFNFFYGSSAGSKSKERLIGRDKV